MQTARNEGQQVKRMKTGRSVSMDPTNMHPLITRIHAEVPILDCKRRQPPAKLQRELPCQQTSVGLKEKVSPAGGGMEIHGGTRYSLLVSTKSHWQASLCSRCRSTNPLSRLKLLAGFAWAIISFDSHVLNPPHNVSLV